MPESDIFIMLNGSLEEKKLVWDILNHIFFGKFSRTCGQIIIRKTIDVLGRSLTRKRTGDPAKQQNHDAVQDSKLGKSRSFEGCSLSQHRGSLTIKSMNILLIPAFPYTVWNWTGIIFRQKHTYHWTHQDKKTYIPQIRSLIPEKDLLRP